MVHITPVSNSLLRSGPISSKVHSFTSEVLTAAVLACCRYPKQYFMSEVCQSSPAVQSQYKILPTLPSPAYRDDIVSLLLSGTTCTAAWAQREKPC